MKIEKLIEVLAKETQTPIEDLWQLYYEGKEKFEQYLLNYFIEFHLDPQCTKACHHFDPPEYTRDAVRVGIDIDGFYVYILSYIPKNIIKGHHAFFQIGDITIEMGEDDGFWQSHRLLKTTL